MPKCGRVSIFARNSSKAIQNGAAESARRVGWLAAAVVLVLAGFARAGSTDLSFSADPVAITAGEAVTLTWCSTNKQCNASGSWSGSKSACGSETLYPTADATYVLDCNGFGPPSAGSVSVSVASSAPAPTVSLTADPTSITAGESSTLSWSSTDAGSCEASGAWSGTKATTGSVTVSPVSDATYNLSCTGSGGSASDSVSITVMAPAPTVSLAADPASITAGESSTLSWSSTYADSCEASGAWSGTKATSGTATVSPTSDATYGLSCTGSGGTASDSASITVSTSTSGFTALLEVENGSVSSPMEVKSDANALNGAYVVPASGSDTTSPSREASVSASVPASGTYYLWARLYGASGDGDALYVGIDSSWDRVFPSNHGVYEWVPVNNGSGSAGFSLSSGSHVIQVGHGEIGARIDAVYLTTDSADVPTFAPDSTVSAPTVSLTADPTSITEGESSTLSWSSTDADSCEASGDWSGTKATSGTETVSPASDAIYTLSCTNSGGTTSDSVSVAVSSSSGSDGGGSGGSTDEFAGFGASTPGGNGQPVYHVTTLNDSGPGSLREALSQGNRYVVFDVAGEIDLKSEILVQGAYITVDGFSAPSPGITLRGAGIVMDGGLSSLTADPANSTVHDIILQGIRIREVGLNGNDGIGVNWGAHDVVIDHVSVDGCGDGNIDITHNAHDVTVSWSIFSNCSKNSLIKYNTDRVSVHHNVFIHSLWRNPWISNLGEEASDTSVDFRNNLVWGWYEGGGSGVECGAKVNLVNNYYSSPDSSSSNQNRAVIIKTSCSDGPTGALAYMSGNVSADLTENINGRATVSTEFAAPAVETTDACNAAHQALSGAGVAPLDTLDQSHLADVNLPACN